MRQKRALVECLENTLSNSVSFQEPTQTGLNNIPYELMMPNEFMRRKKDPIHCTQATNPPSGMISCEVGSAMFPSPCWPSS